MNLPKILKVDLLLSVCLFSSVAHSECIGRSYKIYGAVVNSAGQKLPASIKFSWLENEANERNLATHTDAGDYSATLQFFTESKATPASGHLYNCDAKLASVRYVIKARGHLPLTGSVKLSGESTLANFTMASHSSSGTPR